ncbi:MAG: inositol monophosphatase [Candidatus Heimdallarchaeota archaeon]|nr:MAG: inositol monophosphatase [Candidatus Heimdallarchaeota archaeon]
MTKKFLNVAIEASQKAGKLIIDLFYKDIEITTKPDQSIITEADLKADTIIRSIIYENFPSHDVLSEESGRSNHSSEYLWIIDPLDGSTNFSVRNPFIAVSIGLLRRDHPLLGVVYSPFQDELFRAEINRGAFLNNKPISVDEKVAFENAFLAFDNGRDLHSRNKMIQIYKRLKARNNKVRQVGAAALELCYVASGRFGAFIAPGLNSWDILAGELIVKEANGLTTDFQNNSFTLTSSNIIASSHSLHPILLDIVKDLPRKD